MTDLPYGFSSSQHSRLRNANPSTEFALLLRGHMPVLLTNLQFRSAQQAAQKKLNADRKKWERNRAEKEAVSVGLCFFFEAVCPLTCRTHRKDAVLKELERSHVNRWLRVYVAAHLHAHHVVHTPCGPYTMCPYTMWSIHHVVHCFNNQAHAGSHCNCKFLSLCSLISQCLSPVRRCIKIPCEALPSVLLNALRACFT